MTDYYYKIMDYEKGDLKTLFHGHEGSRTVPMYEWLKAKVKKVYDGSDKRSYVCGWHVFESFDECKHYLTKFKNRKNKVIARCRVKGDIWAKKHSRSNVLLTEWLYICGISGGKKIEGN